MSRTYDPRGKLVQTVQHVSTPTAHDITTSYAYDPDRLASPITGPQTALDTPLGERDVLRVLARIARTGKPGNRLRAAELIGKQLGMFREEAQRGPTLEERF